MVRKVLAEVIVPVASDTDQYTVKLHVLNKMFVLYLLQSLILTKYYPFRGWTCNTLPLYLLSLSETSKLSFLKPHSHLKLTGCIYMCN